MNKIEYKALKKTAMKEFGADDKESLDYYAQKLEKFAKYYKYMAIALFIVSIPLSLLIIGIPMMIGSLVLYFVIHKKAVRKISAFREHLKNDPELASS